MEVISTYREINKHLSKSFPQIINGFLKIMAWFLLDSHLTFWFRITYLSLICSFFSQKICQIAVNKHLWWLGFLPAWIMIFDFFFFFFNMQHHGNSTKGHMSSCPCSQWHQQCHSSRLEQPAVLKKESESASLTKHGMTFFFSSSVIFTTKVSVVFCSFSSWKG